MTGAIITILQMMRRQQEEDEEDEKCRAEKMKCDLATRTTKPLLPEDQRRLEKSDKEKQVYEDGEYIKLCVEQDFHQIQAGLYRGISQVYHKQNRIQKWGVGIGLAASLALAGTGAYFMPKSTSYMHEKPQATISAPVSGLAIPEGERVYQTGSGRDVKKLTFDAEGNLVRVVSIEDGKVVEK